MLPCKMPQADREAIGFAKSVEFHHLVVRWWSPGVKSSVSFADMSNEGLLFKVYKEFIQLKTYTLKNKKQSNKKMGKRPE